MKSFVLIVCLTLSSACASAPPTIVTTPGKVAYTADQIVQRVNELENAAIAANGAQQLPTTTTREIVEFCVAADKTLATTPTGWQATLSTAWTLAKGKIGTVANPAVAAALAAVDLALASLGGGL